MLCVSIQCPKHSLMHPVNKTHYKPVLMHDRIQYLSSNVIQSIVNVCKWMDFSFIKQTAAELWMIFALHVLIKPLVVINLSFFMRPTFKMENNLLFFFFALIWCWLQSGWTNQLLLSCTFKFLRSLELDPTQNCARWIGFGRSNTRDLFFFFTSVPH